MEDNVLVEQGGIQCDNCDWKDITPLSTVEMETYLGKPCPVCGANLLTEEDLLEYSKFMSALEVVNSMSPAEINDFVADFDEDAIIDAYQKAKSMGLSQSPENKDKWVYDKKQNDVKKA